MSPGCSTRRVGQLAFVGFDGKAVTPELRAIASAFDLAGVVLFSRNVESPGQVADLVRDLQQLETSAPVWVAVDQEGGRVARLRRPFTEWPPMATLGRANDEAIAAAFAHALAAELSLVGISLNLAPVVDVLTRADNPAIGDRALSDEPEVVARLGAVLVREFEDEGVASCAKHFPGHGDTTVDSHLELPLVDCSPERLRDIELRPFRRAIRAGTSAVLVAHVMVPALDEERPASLSPVIVDGWLRGEMRFGGLVLTDDLAMKAISSRYVQARATQLAVAAGCDAALLCAPDPDGQVAALEALVHAFENRDIPAARLDDTVRRHEEAKARVAAAMVRARHRAGLDGPVPLSRDWRPPSAEVLRGVLGCTRHQAIAEEMGTWR